jgi:sugar fermentation stimulation protein A
MHFDFDVIPAAFVERPNRFVIRARLGSGEVVTAHCPNPGRMKELMVAGARVYLSHDPDPRRRTAYSLRFVEHPVAGQLISLNTQLPNHLFAEGLAQGWFTQFADWSTVEREVSVPGALTGDGGVTSRIDFRLRGEGRPDWWVETKSVTLVEEDGWAYFPDAPTQRGQRHLHELTQMQAQGLSTAVVFIVQRPDALALSPQWDVDPAFAQALAHAQANGVALHAYTCNLTTQAIWFEQEIPVVVGD